MTVPTCPKCGTSLFACGDVLNKARQVVAHQFACCFHGYFNQDPKTRALTEASP